MLNFITANVKALVKFYEQVTGITAIQYTDDFAMLQTGSATLAIESTRTLQLLGSEDIAKAAPNRTAIIKFIVKKM